MSEINWQATRRLFKDVDGEMYVETSPGMFLELDDYREGGAPIHVSELPTLRYYGTRSNAQISNMS